MANSVEAAIRSAMTKGVMAMSQFNRDRMPAPDAAHPFLTGIHRPMEHEATLVDLEVRGEIPEGLDGAYIRIGPNPAAAPNPAAYHWFISDGMVHGLRLRQGKALWYRNRWVRSNGVTQALGEAPAKGPRNGLSDTVNTNVLGHAGKIWAVVEAGAFPVELDENLETVAHNPFEGSLKGSFSAHPHLDPKTGELHAICYTGADPSVLRHVVVGADGRVRRNEPVPVKNGPSVHDCALTNSYVLIFDLPVTFSMKTLIAGFPFPYVWNPDHKARVGLLPREGAASEVIWCEVEPCYVFHPCNAFEADDGTVIVDVVAYKTMFAEHFKGPDSSDTKFERWTISPGDQRVVRTVLDSRSQEFPRCDERLTGQPYRYAYSMPLIDDHPAYLSDTYLIKHDLKLGTKARHDFGAGRHPGEFVFVPKHAKAAEDEGWLMGYVVDVNSQTTDFVILDAQNFEGRPQAVVMIPHRIPPGFHGNWVADAPVL